MTINQEERALILQYQHGEREEAYTKLFERHKGFIYQQAAFHKRRYRVALEIDDLVQEGQLGLMEALDRFDCNATNSFLSYATWWIRKYQARAVWQATNVVSMTEYFRNMSFRAHESVDALRQELGREPEAAEVDEALAAAGVPVRHKEYYLQEVRASPLDERIEAGDENPEEALFQKELSKVRANYEALATRILTERQRATIESRFLTEEPLTREAIGARFGVRREAIRTAENEALKRLRRHAHRLV